MSGPPASSSAAWMSSSSPDAIRHFVCADDHGAVDAEEVRREHERAEHVVGDAGARVAQDLRVAGLEPEHLQRLDPRVDAREHGEAPGRARFEPGEPELVCIRLVGGEHVCESRVAGHRRIVGRMPRWPHVVVVGYSGFRAMTLP